MRYIRWKDLERFTELLKGFGVQVLVDVRRFPHSKNPQFTKESLETELPRHGIKYEYLGKSLGGFRKGGYEKHMGASKYKGGIRRLLSFCKKNTVAIMCLEPKSNCCHRRFIMPTLSHLGFEVIPIE